MEVISEFDLERPLGNKDQWNDELASLGVYVKMTNEFNDEEELGNLAEIIKQSMYRDYKTAYGANLEKTKIDEPHFKNLN